MTSFHFANFRIESADQIITEQQLGLKYEPREKSTGGENQAEEKRSAMDYARAVLSGQDIFHSLDSSRYRSVLKERLFKVSTF